MRAKSRAVHSVEAFGPVSTVIGYAGIADAIAIARRGEGSLAGSVFTADDRVAAELVLGLAPYHGRVLVVNRHCAKESTGHGSPLAPLVHGGPGRAGGGEELGGIRGVLHYMQRTAVQGTPDVITAVGGRWARGSTERDPGSASVPQAVPRARDRRHVSFRGARGHGRRTSSASRRSPATVSMRTWTRPRRRAIPCSAVAWRTAIS